MKTDAFEEGYNVGDKIDIDVRPSRETVSD